MRWLLKCTVRTAVAVGLLDLEVQAVDGTKVAANAARDQTCDAAKLERLLAKTEDAIGELENQNEGGGEPSPPHLPAELQQAQVLRERIQHAMNRLAQDHRLTRVNLTDQDAQLMKGRQGIMPGYNAQAMASPVAQSSGNGMLITAADVVDSAADSGQLVPMLEQAEEMIGEPVPVTLADGGYHTAANLAAGEQRGDLLVMPERYHPGVHRVPTSKISSSMVLSLTLTSVLRAVFTLSRPPQEKRKGSGTIPSLPGLKDRVSRLPRLRCLHQRRALWIGPTDVLLRQHRDWMTTERARGLYARRKGADRAHIRHS